MNRFPRLRLLLTDTKVARQTATLVANVRTLKADHAEVVDPILESIHAITNKAVACLQQLEKAAGEERGMIAFTHQISYFNA